MTLALTPLILAAAYEYLRETLPFKNWKLPHADSVEFHVTRHRDRYGDHNEIARPVEHCIRASAVNISTTNELIEFMGHEMIHCYLWTTKNDGGKRVQHNAEFRRIARRVCGIHGWEYKSFMYGT